MSGLLRPRAISPDDSIAEFDCGQSSLNDWLRHRAVANERGGASRTFVSVDKLSHVVAGYYCLLANSLQSDHAPGALRRNMPHSIPVILIGRLAVDLRFEGQGLGAALLQDAFVKSIEAAQLVGARALLVHALNEAAESFYGKFGFEPLSQVPHSMHLLISDAEATLAAVAH